MKYNISGGFAFYGYIPYNSNEQHLGIVLGVNDPYLKYCYCTSKFREIIKDEDVVIIPASVMEKYFNNPKETFIFLSQRHIIDMLLTTFLSRLSSSEYEEKGQIDNDILITILSKIRNSDNLSERFKNEFFAFIDNAE
jgi:hypothetical protein